MTAMLLKKYQWEKSFIAKSFVMTQACMKRKPFCHCFCLTWLNSPLSAMSICHSSWEPASFRQQQMTTIESSGVFPDLDGTLLMEPLPQWKARLSAEGEKKKKNLSRKSILQDVFKCFFSRRIGLRFWPSGTTRRRLSCGGTNCSTTRKIAQWKWWESLEKSSLIFCVLLSFSGHHIINRSKNKAYTVLPLTFSPCY